MQRRAYASGLAALLAAVSATALAGCSSDSGTDSSGTDAKTGTTAGTIAQPGRYRTLFEPCGSVPLATLQDMLPSVTALPVEQRDRVLRGTAAVTYDTDRRVGCAWKADGPDATHHLSLDFERVVSYDPSVSDETRAQEVYTTKESAAGLAPASPPTTAAPSTGAPAAPLTGASKPAAPAAPLTGASKPAAAPGTAGTALVPGGQQAQTVSPGTPTPTPTASTPPEGLESRTLTDLGDVAFLDDVLTPAGSVTQQRVVSVVFRTSNVIVTVRYAAQPTRVGEVPDSEELQEKARRLADRLAERFDE
ncbi:DUF3558 domain-containing protein [Streptomyces roseolilacinus]|uniref:DUF3558 domain-containing protein n=1 Tax=Streptomyces roseolilacinus TaxID=66904 RepID=A0A918AYD0_9ACTN|nr:DUF3558 domain-containing protein [Streptomyces roseolilacinus]GGP92661.1 hypothetical protein GCM10010249_08450 [Streptomyces roseolilacinus]